MAFGWLQRMTEYLGVRPFSLQPILMWTFGIQDSKTNTVSTSQCLKSKSTIILYDQSFLAAWILQRALTGINRGEKKKCLDPSRDPIHQESSSPTGIYGGYLHKTWQSLWKREEKDIAVTVAKFSHRECTSNSHHSPEKLQSHKPTLQGSCPCKVYSLFSQRGSQTYSLFLRLFPKKEVS